MYGWRDVLDLVKCRILVLLSLGAIMNVTYTILQGVSWELPASDITKATSAVAKG